MKCHEASPIIPAYHDGELDPGQSAALQAHLTNCSSCQTELEKLTRLSEILIAGRSCELPAGLWEQIAARTQIRRRGHSRYYWLAHMTAAAAGFALYFLGHDALSSVSAPVSGTPASQTMQIEQVLSDTAQVLAGADWHDDQFAALGQRPEMLLLRELREGGQP
ncbi:MAG: zf-HC2 domain-containing protein [Planctomycetota bacterium]